MIESSAREGARGEPTDMRRLGAEYGHDLAAALLLTVSRHGADQGVKRQLAQLVLREITIAVDEFRRSRIAELSVSAFEQACREACRAALMQGVTPLDAKSRYAA